MKLGFYRKTAWSNLRKNYRFFIPRILAEAGLLAVYYIVFTLKTDSRIAGLHGGDYLGVFMSIGTVVIAVLSVVLMLYINSFLMKQRKREFGLYTILGMEKRHVARVMLFETAFSSGFALIGGLLTGAVFYKLCSLLVCRLLNTEIILGFYYLRMDSLLLSALFFVLLDALTYAVNAIGIARTKPVDLLASRAVGEKEPRVKWPLLILGCLALGGGYYISLTTVNPLSALLLFFIAVILVIIGTYFLFTAGSIFILKLQKRNKKFYLHKNRMTAVAGLLYRMKQNAVGLASICILATGVLVMISTTVSLYAGIQDTLDKNYPQHLYVSAAYTTDGVRHTVPLTELSHAVTAASEKHGAAIERIDRQRFLEVTYRYENGRFTPEQSDVNMAGNLTGLCNITFLTEEDYRVLTGVSLDLSRNEVAFYSYDDKTALLLHQMTVGEKQFTVVRNLTAFPVRLPMIATANCYGIVLPDDEAMSAVYAEQKQAYGTEASDYTDQLAITYRKETQLTDIGPLMQEEIEKTVKPYLMARADTGNRFLYLDSVWDAEESLYGMYGTLLLLGVLLGGVCLFATALIIYYKQISEGYEDRARFQILQKIGMSESEVKNTIRIQVLLVFFLPLIAAGIHLIVAFPMLETMLHILLLSSTDLFIRCSCVTFAVFALIYVLIYSTTAKTYYKIVH